MYTKKTI